MVTPLTYYRGLNVGLDGRFWCQQLSRNSVLLNVPKFRRGISPLWILWQIIQSSLGTGNEEPAIKHQLQVLTELLLYQQS